MKIFHSEPFQVVINTSTKHEKKIIQNIIKLLYPESRQCEIRDSVDFQSEASL